jgi:hypothetical protein
MIYFEHDQDHCILMPTLAFSLRGEFWLGICWLNMEFGWREGSGGEREPSQNEMRLS